MLMVLSMRKTVLGLLRAAATAFALLLAVSSAVAQTATVDRNVNLRRDSSTDQAPIRLLKPPTKLQLLQSAQDDGYYNVRTAEGQEGWVWAKNVTIDLGDTATFGVIAAVPGLSAIPDDWDRPTPHDGSMSGPSGSCPFAGQGAEGDSNRRKNRTDIPSSYHDVTFDALASLAYPTAKKHRSDWTPAQLAIIEPHEGIAVRVVGFLVALRPQTGNEEDTNCKFSKAVETDWHMAVVAQAGQGEEKAVVVETTPRIRKKHPKWTAARLKDWVDSDQPVRISGWTFLDTEHRNHLKKYRQTLWEIHPITKIEVFKAGKWVDLDSLP
jgi:hypothetical protein